MSKKKKLPGEDEAPVATLPEAKAWAAAREVIEIECLVPDLAGVARGKIMPASKFLDDPVMALPSSIFMQTISGEYPEESDSFRYDPADGDIELHPDFATLSDVPWAHDPTAQVIHDALFHDGRPVEVAPRQVLKRIIGLYARRGWKAVVAPELEFYLVKRNLDPDYPLEPPVGRSGRAEAGRRSYSISAVNEFDAVFEDIYAFAEAQALEVDTLIHEEGAAQMEINLRHGDPLWLADQVFLLKRTIREAALKHDIYATFMAKPIAHEPGSAMHIHQSVVDAVTEENIFTGPNGKPTAAFFHFIGGQQKYIAPVTCMLAPYVNSYRRLVKSASAPVNTQWGYDNRTTGLRIPPSSPANRRVENRVPSSDANPYLAMAATLAAGYLGLVQRLEPGEPTEGEAQSDDLDLPGGLLEAVDLFEGTEELAELFGRSFMSTFTAVKRAEFATFMRVISPWEREFLLLNV
ncbi:MAG TPA: glutamine synthetase family protein [Caulobacteraceae bacterium]|nr:glutamine synthetase family protein [Caulobacteraceae bacterium]